LEHLSEHFEHSEHEHITELEVEDLET